MGANNKLFTYEFVSDYFFNFGYILLDDIYVNSKTKMQVKCPKGHVYLTRYNIFSGGGRCPHCHDDNQRCSNDTIEILVEGVGYKILLVDYPNLTIKCNNGHIYKTDFHTFKKGVRCSECQHDRQRRSIIDVISIIKYKKHELISGVYKNVHSKLLVKCENGHVRNTTLHDMIRNGGCFSCGFSQAENEIADFLLLIGVKNIIRGTRKIISPYEIDLFLPDFKIGIEFNGTYWHKMSTLKKNKPNWSIGRIKNYHSIKTNKAKRAGVTLLHIKEEDWVNKRDLIKNKIEQLITKRR